MYIREIIDTTTYEPYVLPNGSELRHPGDSVRIPAKLIWDISKEDIEKFGLELDDDKVSPSPFAGRAVSEVIRRTK